MELSLCFSEKVIAKGFAIVPEVLDSPQVSHLIEALLGLAESDSVRTRGGTFAVRSLLDMLPEVLQVANSAAIRNLVTPILGESAFPVRGILFDKTPGANWKVPWHQDVTIAVKSRVDVEGFGPWSTKAGVVHVQPPAQVLEEMLSVRIHLDPCAETNGALKVVHGSHRLGRLPESEAARIGAAGPVVVCTAGAGDALLMRPLLLHASSASETPNHRRVLHIDYASSGLVGGLRWATG